MNEILRDGWTPRLGRFIAYKPGVTTPSPVAEGAGRAAANSLPIPASFRAADSARHSSAVGVEPDVIHIRSLDRHRDRGGGLDRRGAFPPGQHEADGRFGLHSICDPLDWKAQTSFTSLAKSKLTHPGYLVPTKGAGAMSNLSSRTAWKKAALVAAIGIFA